LLVILALGTEITDKTSSLATKEDVANAKTDMIKWMFIFWIGQIAATFGFIILCLKKRVN